MQNLIFLLVALLISGNLYAQHGIKLGVHFTPGTSFSLNNEDLDKGIPHWTWKALLLSILDLQ
jgi:hypothetical protein